MVRLPVHRFVLRMIATGDWAEEADTHGYAAELIENGDLVRDQGVLKLTQQGHAAVDTNKGVDKNPEVEVRVYRREAGTASKEELAARPWQCDIFIRATGEDHHGVGDKAMTALHLATRHWMRKGETL